MWTTSELSKLTGVPKRTLQYWSQERKQDSKGREIGGAGILPSIVDPESGYRTFGRDALARVLMIRLAKEAGCSQAEIQEFMDSIANGFDGSIEAYIKGLRAEQEKIERKIRLLQAMCLFERPNQDKRNAVGALGASEGSHAHSELASLVALDLVDCLIRNAPDVSPESLRAAVKEWSEGGYAAMLMELRLGDMSLIGSDQTEGMQGSVPAE